MSRRLARAGRLGQRSTGQGKPWSPASIPGLEGWWSADDALASVGPDVAARPGDRVRSVRDSSKHGRDMDQTTANRQPMLGYLRPPEGNLLLYSDDTSNTQGWERSTDGAAPVQVTVEPSEELDPFGNPTMRVTVPAGQPSWAGLRNAGSIPGVSQVPPRPCKFKSWVKALTPYSISLGINFNGSQGWARPATIDDGWILLEGVHRTESGGNAVWGVRGAAPLDEDRVFLVGRSWLAYGEWSDEHVITGNERSIPDTTDLPRALVFDGVVGNMLETSEELGNSTDVTVVAVHGLSYVGVATGEHIYHPVSNGGVGIRKSWANPAAPVLRYWRAEYDLVGPVVGEGPDISTITQDEEGVISFRDKGRLLNQQSRPEQVNTNSTAYRIGARSVDQSGSYANGPITDVLYFTRALSDSEIQRVEDYFLIKSGINRIVTEESEVKELETVKALAPGIWYLDGVAINVEPVRQIVVPAGSAGQELTVNDSYGIEVLP